MKQFLAALLIFALGVVASWAVFSATAEIQEQKEIELAQLEDKIETAKIGSHVKLLGHGFLKTSRPAQTAQK